MLLFCHHQRRLLSTRSPLHEVGKFTANCNIAAFNKIIVLRERHSPSPPPLTSRVLPMCFLRTRTGTGASPPPPAAAAAPRSVREDRPPPAIPPSGRPAQLFQELRCDEEREARHEPETGFPSLAALQNKRQLVLSCNDVEGFVL